MVIAIAVVLLVLFIPMKGRSYETIVPVRVVDERDTMFSRNELKPGEVRFDEYYRDHPDKKQPDDMFRRKPGLLSKESANYNDLAFAAADASFEAVTAFFDLRSKSMGHGARGLGSSSADATESGERLTLFIKEWGRKMGAHSVGIAEMKDYHYYTIGGRRERYGKPVVPEHLYGIVFTVEMDHELTGTGPQAPAVAESARQYLNSGMIATQVALTLRNLGYDATTHIDANYDVICPLVAKDAGLGEIGRMGLLMTPQLGPRVRISVVTTNAPLVPSQPSHDSTVIDFCTRCSKCSEACPAGSIPDGPVTDRENNYLWKISHEKCYTFWCHSGTDCARCLAVCPYSHPDTFFHRFIRRGITNNFIFRRLAVKMDDIIYGRKPAPAKIPGWFEG